MTREEPSVERAEFEAALAQADALLSPPLPREVIARVLVAHAEATRERDEAEADLGQVAVALGLAKDSPAISVIECAKAERAELNEIRGVVGRPELSLVEAVRRRGDDARESQNTLRSALDAASHSIGQIAAALGLSEHAPADAVIARAKVTRAALNLRDALERVAEAAGVDTASEADFIADRVTAVIKRLRDRTQTAATPTTATVAELLATAPDGALIEYARDEPGKFAQIQTVAGKFWRRRSWADGAWWSWGDVSVLEIDVLKRRACLVTAAAGLDPASRWNGGGS